MKNYMAYQISMTEKKDQILYGTKMIVTDLILTSFWAVFAAKSTPEIEYWELAVILMRLILCFQLFKQSRWSGYSAIMFACVYFMLPKHNSFGFQYAPVEMIYYALHIVDWNIANEFILHPDTFGFQLSCCLIWVLLTIWLVIMPIIILFISRNIFKFPKWSWFNIISIAVIALIGLRGYQLYNLVALWIVVSCYLPVVYWIIVNGRNKSLVDVISENKPLIYYCAFVALFLCAITFGFRNLYVMRFVGFLCFPAIFYILLGKTKDLRHIPTYDTVFICLSGFVYWFCLGFGKIEKVIGFIVAAIILIIVAIRLAKFTSSKFLGVSLFVGTFVILYPALWGMNPYIVLDASHTRLFMKKTGACHGLYVTDNYDGKCGLRDRYGEILPMKYFTIDILDYDGDQDILCCLETISDNAARPDYDDFYSFFNLKTRQFINIPDGIPVKSIEMKRKGVYALFNEAELPVFYLVMPWCGGYGDDGCYCNEVQIIDKRNISVTKYDNVNFSEDAETHISSDGKIKLISWDTGLGGTLPDYISYIQYMEKDSIITDLFYPHSVDKYVCVSDLQRNGFQIYDGSRIDGLWELDVEGESPVYIVATYNQASSIEGNTLVYALQFDTHGKLIKKQILDKHGDFSDRVGRDYYIPDWSINTNDMGWNWIVSMDDQTQCLYISSSNNDMVMNDRYDIYHYENGRMSYKRTDAGYWLHPNVREFCYLCGIYRTNDRLYRLDWLGDSYRLTVWKSNKAMSDEPEMILTNGKEMDNHVHFAHDSLTFTIPLYWKGQDNDLENVTIMKDGKIIEDKDV